MAIDESFKKQGAIPFKWEIRPGVPKVQPEQQHGFDSKISHKDQLKEKSHHNHIKAFPESTPTKLALAPPPARLITPLQPQVEPRIRSVLSGSRALSERYSFFTSNIVRSADVYSFGCLPSYSLLRKNDRNKRKLKILPESEPDRFSDLETLSQGSLSSRRKPSSPFLGSSPAFSSLRSSPRDTNDDAEWAGFGLF